MEGIGIFQKMISIYLFFFLLGHFWVFSDSHVDTLYRNDGDPATNCRNVALNNMTKIIRRFGHFDCDTPFELLVSAMSAAKKIDSNVDFLIWLG
jgi:sphingomyelin phosphodiesterase acid-like 3